MLPLRFTPPKIKKMSNCLFTLDGAFFRMKIANQLNSSYHHEPNHDEQMMSRAISRQNSTPFKLRPVAFLLFFSNLYYIYINFQIVLTNIFNLCDGAINEN